MKKNSPSGYFLFVKRKRVKYLARVWTIGFINKPLARRDICWRIYDQAIKKIRAKVDQHTLSTHNAEIACLIRDKSTDEDIKAMGLVWIVIMHESITD